MKLAERKYTTRTAMAELGALFDSINSRNLEDDIAPIESAGFAIRAHDSNGYNPSDYNYNEWFYHIGRIVCRNGVISIEACETDAENYYEPRYRVYSPGEYWHISRVDFAGLMHALKTVIEKYNTLSAQKDDEIERFLNVIKEWY